MYLTVSIVGAQELPYNATIEFICPEEIHIVHFTGRIADFKPEGASQVLTRGQELEASARESFRAAWRGHSVPLRAKNSVKL